MFLPTARELFFTKNDPSDLRLGDIFKSTTDNFNADDFLIFGYPDDEGIKLNGGRLGSALAPPLIRQFLYKMTLPENYFKSDRKKTQYIDHGNLEIVGDLYLRHEHVKNTLLQSYKQKAKIISLGGGHDYGYPDGAAFIQHFTATQGHKKPLIINFDAHLDVRSVVKNSMQNLNSGTPFYRLLSEFKNKFNLLEIGLQKQCNSVEHWRWANEQGAETISLDKISENGWDVVLKNKMIQNLDSTTPVLISFDIDALTAAEAGGCSQAWATGLHISDCLQFLKKLYKMADVRGFGIYEVSPPLDRDFQTSKTAALLAHHFIFNSKA